MINLAVNMSSLEALTGLHFPRDNELSTRRLPFIKPRGLVEWSRSFLHPNGNFNMNKNLTIFSLIRIYHQEEPTVATDAFDAMSLGVSGSIMATRPYVVSDDNLKVELAGPLCRSCTSTYVACSLLLFAPLLERLTCDLRRISPDAVSDGRRMRKLWITCLWRLAGAARHASRFLITLYDCSRYSVCCSSAVALLRRHPEQVVSSLALPILVPTTTPTKSAAQGSRTGMGTPGNLPTWIAALLLIVELYRCCLTDKDQPTLKASRLCAHAVIFFR